MVCGAPRFGSEPWSGLSEIRACTTMGATRIPLRFTRLHGAPYVGGPKLATRDLHMTSGLKIIVFDLIKSFLKILSSLFLFILLII